MLSGPAATKRLLSGINKLNDAVSCTLGPKGKTVIIGKHQGNAPHITKDGVTVSESFELEDYVENLGASIIKQSAAKTADIAGDGTTSTITLAHAMVTHGLKAITKGANPMDVKRGIDEAVYAMKLHLESISKPVDTPELFRQIAIISANNDEGLGGLIASAFNKVGNDGMITVEESRGYETSLSLVDGLQVDGGFLSPHMVTDKARGVCEFVNPMIILIGQSVAMMRDLVPLLEMIANSTEKRPLAPIIFIAENLKDEALATLVWNHVKGIIPCCAIKSPSFGPLQKALMEDVAMFTGAKYISQEKGLTLEKAGMECIGYAERVKVEENKTMIYFGKGDKAALDIYCNDLRGSIAEATNERSRNILKNRLARLVTGVAVINVGGATEIEVNEKKDRIDDAIRAVRAASEEGFVVGGGTALLHCSDVLYDVVSNSGNKDQTLGIQIVRKALEAPFLKILYNACLLKDNGSWVSKFKKGRMIKKVLKNEYGFGINTMTDTFENLLEAGVIDPTKVARVALENAASVAGTFLTTACVLQDTMGVNGQG